MKKILYLVISLGLFSACDMDLEQQPISAASSDTYFQTVNDFNQGLNAIYSSAREYPNRLMNLSETRSDNLHAISDGGVRDWEGINSFHRNIMSNPYVEEAWQVNFTGIFRANNYLEQLQENGEQIIVDADVRQRLEGQVRFFRAFYYFDLLRYFGKLPLIDRVVTANEAKEIPRSEVTEIYNFIIDDLMIAINYLPTLREYGNSDRGRVNKYAAKMLLGLVYMTRSGPELGVDGAGLNTNEWGEAVQQFDDIINSNEFELLSTYTGIFDYDNEHNAEVIFNVEYASGENPVVGATFPWVLVPDTWFESLGFGVQGGLTIRPVSADLLNTYEEGDERRTFSIQEGYTYGNNVVENRPFVKKFVDVTRIPTTSRMDWPINYIVYRYTDLLMLKAECVLQGAPGSRTTDVDDVVNAVRTRAGLETSLNNVTLEQLMAERRREFVGEGMRWFDLIRSGTVESTISSWIAEEDPGQMEDFRVEYVLYPIPQSELNTAPGLYEQNQGY